MKGPLWPSQSFWESDLSVFSWLDSFHIFFALIYKDFSVQVHLSLHTCKFFQAKRNYKVTAQQPLPVQENSGGQGAAAWPCPSWYTGVSAASHPTGPCMAPAKYVTWLCLGASSPGGAVSLTYLEFATGAFYLSVPCLKPKQMSFNYSSNFLSPNPT